MKRIVPVFLTLCLLAGCAASPEQVSPPDEQAVLDAYAAAAEVYDWFSMHTLPTGIEAIQLDGNIYYPVEYDGITAMDDLEDRVRAAFSPEISDALLSDGSYREIDGKLCCTGGARGQNVYLLDRTLSARQVDEGHWTVTITFWADFVDHPIQADGYPHAVSTVGYSQRTLDYEKADEGWRFTSFCPSDDLDLDADTVCTIDYYQDFEVTGAYWDYTDWQLVCYLIYADGAYAEAPGDLLYQRFLERPGDILAALALLDGAPYREKGPPMNIDAVVNGPGASAAWLSFDQQIEFLNVLGRCQPRTEAEQAVLDKIRAAYERNTASTKEAVNSQFALDVDGKLLCLGDQEGSFPWEYGLTAESQTHHEASDGADPFEETDCGAFTVSYNVSPEDGTESVFRMIVDGPGIATAGGIAVGASEADVLAAYPSAVAVKAVGEDQWSADYGLVFEPGQWAYCKHITFFMKDGAVAAMEIEDLMDGRLLS